MKTTLPLFGVVYDIKTENIKNFETSVARLPNPSNLFLVWQNLHNDLKLRLEALRQERIAFGMGMADLKEGDIDTKDLMMALTNAIIEDRNNVGCHFPEYNGPTI
jgi:hypothetical protein